MINTKYLFYIYKSFRQALPQILDFAVFINLGVDCRKLPSSYEVKKRNKTVTMCIFFLKVNVSMSVFQHNKKI